MAKGVVCLEDGTLAWYDQGTEGIAHQLVYLHFIPPSPKDEAGQDKRKTLICFLYLYESRLEEKTRLSLSNSEKAAKSVTLQKTIFQQQYQHDLYTTISALLSLNTLHSISGSEFVII